MYDRKDQILALAFRQKASKRGQEVGVERVGFQVWGVLLPFLFCTLDLELSDTIVYAP